MLSIFNELKTCDDKFYITTIFTACTSSKIKFLSKKILIARKKMKSVHVVELISLKFLIACLCWQFKKTSCLLEKGFSV